MRKSSLNFKTSFLGRSCMVIFMLLAMNWACLNAKTVVGKVFDQNKDPLIGATVMVDGTKTATVTDFDGNFSIEANDGQTLVVSYIGYISKKVTVSGNNLTIYLDSDDTGLEEVVVIGYGTARRSDLTGSIASINGENLREVPASDITESLQGRIAGVDLTTTNSQPGSSMQIRIRGQRSLTASNDPLIVLDGIPFMGSLSDIDPSAIKSMDILKDASSTAIYGSRGANGVIMITTHKGHMEQPAQLKYSGYFGFSKAVPYPMMTGDQLAALRDARGQYTDGPDEVRGTNTDWQKEFYRTGIQHNHSLSVSGGTKGGSYNVGLGFNQNKGVVPTQEFKRYSINANFDTKIGEWVRFGISTNTNYTQFDGGQVGLYGVLSSSPLVNPYNADGTIKRGFQTAADQSWTMTRQTVEAVEETWLSKNYGLGTYNTAFAEITQPWVPGLSYRINLGANYRSRKAGSFTGTGVNSYQVDSPNGASLNRSETTNWTVENILTYDNTFAEKHHLNVTAMFSAEQTIWDQTYISGQKIPAEYFQFYNIGYAEQNLAVPTGSQGYTKSGLMSWMGRVMYTFADRYMISAAFRADASSRL
ncbi:MAG: SusC/RagA family TonB-linked outer membrane protein, partial [Bacteroidaceae bacterium]|nr:SusC/RagA family TonB-linked outer membrane protein [Bacteroidaceae bacterium]